MPLEAQQEAAMLGIRMLRPGIKAIVGPTETKINGQPAISWVYEWPSETGYTVVEYATHMEIRTGTHSIQATTTRRDHKDRMKLYDTILDTYRVLGATAEE